MNCFVVVCDVALLLQGYERESFLFLIACLLNWGGATVHTQTFIPHQPIHSPLGVLW